MRKLRNSAHSDAQEADGVNAILYLIILHLLQLVLHLLTKIFSYRGVVSSLCVGLAETIDKVGQQFLDGCTCHIGDLLCGSKLTLML